MDKDGKPRRATKADQIHPGLGQLTIGQLKKHHIEDWVRAHPDWEGSIRTQLQAVKRAMNAAVESELISRNPIRGIKTPKANARATYLTESQEQAIYKRAKPAFATAVKVLIETGARPGIEFSKLTAHHVADHGNKMTWTFQPDECKTHVLRTIYISDPAIIAIVHKQVELHATGPIFRTPTGKPWTIANLSSRFLTIKKRLAKEGVKLDDDACIYSTRHTRAKRLLEGKVTGRPVSIQTVAKMLGNGVEVCQKHYGKWDQAADEHIWAALQ
jgi:integrase